MLIGWQILGLTTSLKKLFSFLPITSTWVDELAKTACYAMVEGKSSPHPSFCTASHAVDYNDQLTINDNADMEILSLEIGTAIQAQCRETAVKAFDQESFLFPTKFHHEPH